MHGLTAAGVNSMCCLPASSIIYLSSFVSVAYDSAPQFVFRQCTLMCNVCADKAGILSSRFLFAVFS